MANGEIQTYRYNVKDQLIKAIIQKPNQVKEEWQYQYDVLGRRTSKVRLENGKILADSQIEFIWDGSHLVQEIHKSDGKNGTENDRTFSYIYSHPNSYEPLAQLEFAKDNEKPTACYYYHNDQIGVPRELTDEEGKLCWYGSYMGWGKIKEEYDLTEDKSIHQPFRLQNQYCDQETGLHYNFFRYYEPNVGRFTQLDPIGLAGGENLYRFASNVQRQVDPLGLAVICTRPLSMFTDLPKVGDIKSETFLGTNMDLAVNHTHIFYGDGSNLENVNNIGYGKYGIFKETDPNVIKKYKCDTSNIYDDDVMKKAANNISSRRDGIFSKKLQYDADNYGLVSNNCQDFRTEIIKEYDRIINKKEKSLRDILIR